MNYDFDALRSRLDLASDLLLEGDKDAADLMGLSDEEVTALFQHFLDTDTLPDEQTYQVFAQMLRAAGLLEQPHKERV